MYYFHSQGVNSISLKKYVKTIIMGVLLIFLCGGGGGEYLLACLFCFLHFEYSYWLLRLQNLDRSFLSVDIQRDIKLLKYREYDRIKCSVMLPFKISRNKRNGSIAFFEMTRKCYFLLTLSKKPIYLVILKETRQLVYLATSLNSNSTLLEGSSLIRSTMVKRWVLRPCNVVPPAFHRG